MNNAGQPPRPVSRILSLPDASCLRSYPPQHASQPSFAFSSYTPPPFQSPYYLPNLGYPHALPPPGFRLNPSPPRMPPPQMGFPQGYATPFSVQSQPQRQQPYFTPPRLAGGLPLPSATPPTPTSDVSPSRTAAEAEGPSNLISADASSSSVKVLRSKLGSPTVAPFVPPPNSNTLLPVVHVRKPTLTLKPLLSPIPSRGSSPIGSAGFRDREELERRKRMMLVKIPMESDLEVEVDEDGERKPERKKSIIVREPLSAELRRSKLQEMDQELDFTTTLDLVTREQHFDEKAEASLPPSVDIYLPGYAAWDELRPPPVAEERRHRLGDRSPTIGRSPSPFGSFLESLSGRSSPISLQSHIRTGSLFLPSSLPPRLQQAYDNRLRFNGAGGGHKPNFSVGAGLSAFSKPFVMPGAISTPPPASPLGLSPGIKKSLLLPTPPEVMESGAENETSDSNVQAVDVARPRARRLTLEELSRGFGLDLEVGMFHDDFAPMDTVERASSAEEAPGEATAESIEEADQPSSPKGPQPTSPQAHLRIQSLGVGASARILREGRHENYSGEEGGYDGSNSESESSLDEELGLEADGELSEDEYSNPSEEEMARIRAQRRRKARDDHGPLVEVKGETNEDSSTTSGAETSDREDHLLADEESSIDPESMDRGLNRDFHFPPGQTHTPATPPRKLPTPPSQPIVDPATPPPVEITRGSLNPTAPVFVFGRKDPPNPLNLGVLEHKLSSTSLGSAGFGSSIGRPGSLVGSVIGSAPPSPTRPSVGLTSSTFEFKLPPSAPVFVPAALRSPTNPPSSRGPLPPVPLTTIAEHQTRSKRQKVGETAEVAVGITATSSPDLIEEDGRPPGADIGASPGKDNVRTFKFPSESDTTADGAPVSESPRDSTPEPVMWGGKRVDDEFPSLERKVLPSPSRPSSRTPFNSESRPFSIRPIPSLSSEGRVLGFAGIGRRPPIPEFSTTGTMPRIEERRPSGVRQESMDDIAIPSTTRPRSQAIAIPQRSSPANLLSELPTPKAHENRWPSEDVFKSGETIPGLSASGTDSSHHEDDDDDYPLRILEELISDQFKTLRAELSSFTSFKSELDSLSRDALLDTFVGRVEAVLVASRREENEVLERLVDSSSARLEEVVEELKVERVATVQQIKDATILEVAKVQSTSTEWLADLKTSLFDRLKDMMRSELSSIRGPDLPQTLVEANDKIDTTSLAATYLVKLEDFFSTQRQSADALGTEISSRIVAGLEPILMSLRQTYSPPTFEFEAAVERISKLLEKERGADSGPKLVLNPAQSSVVSEEILSSLETHFDRLKSSLQTQLGSLSEHKLESSEQIIELESQLAKARADHGRARSEKAVVSDQLESERTRFQEELKSLRDQLPIREDSSREAEIEKALLMQTVERLQDELKVARGEVGGLEQKLRAAEEKVEGHRLMEYQYQSSIKISEVELAAASRQFHLVEEEKGRLILELAELRAAHERLSSETRSLETSLHSERERLASTEGQISALEKRLNLQDEKIGNLTRLNTSKQNALANSNQRAAELQRRTVELEQTRSELSQAKELSNRLHEENRLHQERFSSVEKDLQIMRETVSRELAEFETLKSENRLLKQRNDTLSNEIEQFYRPSYSYPSPNQHRATRSSAEPILNNGHTPSNERFNWDRPLLAPQSQHPYPTALLNPQNTGSSDSSDETVVHVPLRVESRLGRAARVDSAGWWS